MRPPRGETIPPYEVGHKAIRGVDIPSVGSGFVLGEERLHRACLEGTMLKKAPWADGSVSDELTGLALFIVGESAARGCGQIPCP
jgi:hypothetical protein